MAISGNDQLEVTVKDWERVGRNKYVEFCKLCNKINSVMFVKKEIYMQIPAVKMCSVLLTRRNY